MSCTILTTAISVKKRMSASKIKRGKLKELYSVVIGMAVLDQFGMILGMMSDVVNVAMSMPLNLLIIFLSGIVWFGQIARK